MKKIERFAYAGAAILLSTGFTACTSEDELAEKNSQERGAVKTEFQLNIPTQKNATRMSDAVVQYSDAQNPPLSVFRGIQQIKLIPFNVSTITGSDTRYGNNITLAASTSHVPGRTTANQIDAASLNAGSNSQLYKDVEVMIGTKGFLFYGYAIDAAASGTNVDNVAYTTDEINGKIIASANLDDASKTPSTFEFSLDTRYKSDDPTGKGDAIAAYLSTIANTTGWSTSTNVGMKQLYQDFITMKAGSSRSVQKEVQALYTLLSTGTATDLKTAIMANITSSDVTASEGTLTFPAALSGYPADIYLPDGAAVIAWEGNETDGYKFVNKLATNPSADWTGANVTAPTKYAYPPSLWYRANSDIICDTKYHESDYKNTAFKWADVLNAYNTAYATTSDEVAYGTRSIALKNEVQYAVARLDLSVKANAATLEDNRAILIKEDGTNYTKQDMPVSKDGTNNFQVTGVLIGGQYQKADWEFKPITANETPELTVYDNVIPTAKYMTTTMANVSRTLVMESVDEAPVQFAIEFLNNGNDFYGANGWVRKGTKFYLIGKMVPTGDGNNVKSGSLTQVFKQDYYTTIEATVNNLKKAYNVVPDLRLPQLELGLSVNLTWQAANTYSVTLE